jgi:hypothetical protein
LKALGYTAVALVALAIANGSGRAAQAVAEPTGEVTGRVTDATSGDPIPAAFVNLLVGATPEDPTGLGWLAEADANGVYLLEDVPPGSALLSVTATGYAPFEMFVTVLASDVIEIDVEMNAVSLGAVTGTVTDVVTGDPIPDAFINLLVGATPEDPSGPSISLGESDLNGVYLIEELDPGPALITIDATGYARFEMFIDVPVGATLTVDAAMVLVSATTTTTSGSETLPFTGTSSSIPAVALAFLAVGGMLLVAPRMSSRDGSEGGEY